MPRTREPRNPGAPARHDGGLSLVEMLVAVALLVVISAIVVPMFLNMKEQSENEATRTQVNIFSKTIQVGFTGSLGTPNISGGDGTTTGAISTESATIPKNGAKVYVDAAAKKFCVSKDAKTGQTFAATSSSPGAYAATSACTSATSKPAPSGENQLIIPTGTIDPDFTYPTITTSSANAVRALAFMPDGRMLIGGTFSTVVGGTTRYNIAMLKDTGELDTSWTTETFSNYVVNSIAVHTDGKIYMGGVLALGSGTVGCSRICRYNANGTRDTTFNTRHMVPTSSTDVAKVNLPQPDGKVYVAGYILGAGNGVVSDPYDYGGIVRLNSNGSVDTGFNPPPFSGGASAGTIRAAAVQEDGKVLIAGPFTSVDGKSNYKYLARLNTNGTLDETFSSPTQLTSTKIPTWVTVDDAGKILVSTGQNDIYRFTSGGTLDASFAASPMRGFHILLLPDGQYLASGQSHLDTSGVARRLTTNGSTDTTFIAPPFNGPVLAAAQAADGKYVFVGDFTNAGYVRIVRVA